MKAKNLRLIVPNCSRELGNLVNYHLNKINNTDRNYMTEVESSRFSNGEGKIKLMDSVRDKDLFILTDVGNYGITYDIHGISVPMTPDEHFQDVKRIISATSGVASRISLIMPLLYQSRQHKRRPRESLDCAIALQELEKLGVNNIITFDAHDENVSNAIPLLPFENFYPTHTVLEELIKNEGDKINNLLVVSPDMGAMERARYYAEMLNTDVGVFYKRRDLSRVVNGKNPIVEHIYMGEEVNGKNIIVVDDMIASGESMLEVGRMLKEKGAASVYFIATFTLLTEGYEKFVEGYNEGIFNKLYSTNLSYVPDEVKKQDWYKEVDCSLYLAEIIDNLNENKELDNLRNGKDKILNMVRKIQE